MTTQETLQPVRQAARLHVTEAQREQLETDGYFVTGIVFDEETLGEVRSEFTRLWGEHICEAEKTGDPLTLEQARNRPFMARLDQRSDACRAFCHHDVFRDLSRELVGADVDLTWNQAIVKPPLHAGDNAFAWHQDPWYAIHGDYANDSDPEILRHPTNSFTAWVAITRTTVDNGTLWVLPGRHKEGLLPHVWSDERREYQGQFDTTWKVPVVLRAGQVLVFRRYLPHASGANVSGEVRMAYQLSYSVPGLKLTPSPDLSPLIRKGGAV